MTSWLPTTPGFRKCSRCRVERHDRCNGPTDCGCTDPGHRPLDTYMGGNMTMDNGAAQQDGDPTSVYFEDIQGEVDPRDPMPGMVGFYLPEAIYDQLAGAAELQDRDPVMVLKRAVQHYLGCSRSRCAHVHDEIPQAPKSATTSKAARAAKKGTEKATEAKPGPEPGLEVETGAEEAVAAT